MSSSAPSVTRCPPDDALSQLEATIGRSVSSLRLHETVVLGGPVRLRAVAYSKKKYQHLADLEEATATERAAWGAWGEQAAAARGVRFATTADYDMPDRVPRTRNVTTLERLKRRLLFALEHMPAHFSFETIHGWFIDKHTDDPREVDSEAWLTCRAIFSDGSDRKQYAQLLVKSWPRHYDREMAEAIEAFAAWAKAEYGIAIDFLKNPSRTAPP